MISIATLAALAALLIPTTGAIVPVESTSTTTTTATPVTTTTTTSADETSNDDDEQTNDDGSAGDDPLFSQWSGDFYSIHGDSSKMLNLLSTPSMSTNVQFANVPAHFRTDDLTGNVIDAVGIMLCVGGENHKISMFSDGEVSMEGKVVQSGHHQIDTNTSITVKNHFCRDDQEHGSTDCEFSTGLAPSGFFSTAHRQLTVAYKGTTLLVTVNLVSSPTSPGHGMFRFLEVQLQGAKAPIHGLLGQNALQGKLTPSVEVGVFGQGMSDYKGGMQGEGMIDGVWTDYIEKSLHSSQFAFSEYKCT